MRRVRGDLRPGAFSNGPVAVWAEGSRVGVEIREPVRLEFERTEADWLEVMAVSLLRMRTGDRKTVVSQEEGGRAFGVSRQMINRRWRTHQEHGLAELLRADYDRSPLTPAVRRRVVELLPSDWWMSEEAMAACWVQEGLGSGIRPAPVNEAVRPRDGTQVRERMRQCVRRHAQEDPRDRDGLLDRCFERIEALLAADRGKAQAPYEELCRCRAQSSRGAPRGPYPKDRAASRTHWARDIARKRRRLRRTLEGHWSIGEAARGQPVCPDGGCLVVSHQEDRPRQYRDSQGQLQRVAAARLSCLNPSCATDTFPHPVPGLEYGARSEARAKAQMLRLVFHARSSYARACDYLREEGRLSVRASTALAWVRKAGAEASALELFFDPPAVPVLSLDETWVNLRQLWVYLYKAVNARSGERVAAEVFPVRGQEPARLFLLQLKALGYPPQGVLTDWTDDDDEGLAEVFPGAHHHGCVLHAEMAVGRLIREGLPGPACEGLRDALRAAVRRVFACRTFPQLQTAWNTFLPQQADFPREARPVFEAMGRYLPALQDAIWQPELFPLTHNAAERVIGEFDRRYRITGGFSSLCSRREFLRCFLIYYRLRTFRTPTGFATLRGNAFPGLRWTDVLLLC